MKNGKKVIKLAAMILAAVVLVTCIGSNVTYADTTPYKTYTVDGYGAVNETQEAYLAYTTLIKFGDESFSAPSDICVASDGLIYVADTGNARILVGTLDGELVNIIGEGILQSPQGVYVIGDGTIYVADHDAGEVVVFDQEGNVLAEYGRPDSPLYGDTLEFQPQKIVVNEYGTMFVICDKNTNGIVEISPTEGGTFLGYFGTNSTTADLRTIFLRLILSDEQRAKMVSNVPAAPENLAIDTKGLIYTVTRGEESLTLKRLNIAGINLFSKMDRYADIPTGVAAGNYDNTYVVDQSGYVFEYNNTGDLLFVFGGKDDGTNRIGLSTTTSAINIDDSDRIYILDSDKAQVQVYEPSEFTTLLHEALYLYSKGRYTESKEPLAEVLDMNSMFAYANLAMGRAYYQEENYQQALKYAKLANDKDGYTDAYWEVRNVWLKKWLVTAVVIIVVIFIIWKFLKWLDKKKGIYNGPRKLIKTCRKSKIFDNFCYAGYFMRHPMDGAYGISREGRASWIAPSIILVIFMVEFVINKYLCGFLQKTVREGRYEIGSDIIIIVVAIFAVTVGTYLISTITEGEASIKKTYTYFCYCLTPYLILTPVSFILSHVLTGNEQFLITIVLVVEYVWIIALAFIGIKEVNNYTTWEAVRTVILSAFTIAICALLLFILYMLATQVVSFITSIVGEVVYRLGR